MTHHTDPDWRTILPTVDRDRRHVRTPDGNIVPFAVIGITVSVLAVIAAVEATFGITNWISIPAALLTIGRAGDQIDIATITHDHRNQPPTEGG